MRRGERDQRAILASFGVTVERERAGKGGHKVLYCLGPNGERFVMTTHSSNAPEWRALKNFETKVKHTLLNARR